MRRFTPLSIALPLIALGLLAVQPALSQMTPTNLTLPVTLAVSNTAADSANDNGLMWCIGDGTATLPAGYPTGVVGWGDNTQLLHKNNSAYGGAPNNGGELGNQGLTQSFDRGDPSDVYAIYNDFWNSTTSTSSIGYSQGVSCELFYHNTVNPGQFTITWDPSPSAPTTEEQAWASTGNNAKVFPWYGNNPYSLSITDGGPARYMFEFKGCQWDLNSCTLGSATLTAAGGSNPAPSSPDWNVFPQQLSSVTSIPSSWNIELNTKNPLVTPAWNPGATDGSQIWDASYDIWFDTTGQTDLGIAPYNATADRGQDDGLEIMVWMNSNSSYIDAPGSVPNQPPANSTTGYAQPSGWPRETVTINGIVYDVWTSRLNNPYFGYTGSTVVPGTSNTAAPGYEPYECKTLAENGGSGGTCGVEWNVVSFVAQEGYRQNAMSLDAKVFTDYILGIDDGGLWSNRTTTPVNAGGSATDTNRITNAIGAGSIGALACPLTSSMANQQENPVPSNEALPCLNPSWYLMSVQAGFETWKGGSGLQTDSFQAHVYTTLTAVQSGLSNGNDQPVVYWGAPFWVEYTGCKADYLANPDGNYSATFTLTGFNSQTGGKQSVTYPMVLNTTNLPGVFEYQVPKQYPIHGQASITFTSSCETNPAPLTIFIDPSGQVFYSDGKTPASGATATLLYSPSKSANGPFVAVPNHNYGLTNGDIMAPDDNTVNAMPTTQYGAYGWDVTPGYYEVSAEMPGCDTVTSPVQDVTTTPIENLNLVLPCAPPPLPKASAPSTPSGLTATAVSSSQINLSWSAVPPPNGASVTYTVYGAYPPSNVMKVVASGVTGTSYQVTGLNPSTAYTFTVVAVDASGASPQSPYASATTLGASGNCHVTYTVTNAQPGVTNGLTVDINIQNTGSKAIYPWTLGWTFPGNQQITYAWNVNESQSGEKVSLSSIASWESIPAGSTLSGAVGFNGTYTGADSIPTAFTLNGLPCN